MSAEITSCEEALRLLAMYLDGELEDRTKNELERHLSTCRSCYSRSEFERRLKERLAGSGRADVHPDLRERVRGLIGQFTVPGPE